MAAVGLIPMDQIDKETLFTDVDINRTLAPVLSQKDYDGGLGQCMSLASVDTIRAKHNLLSQRTQKPSRPLASVQHMVHAMTPKPRNYERSVLNYAQQPGLVSEADYESASVIPGTKLRKIEGMEKQQILGNYQYMSMTDLAGNHNKAKIKETGDTFGPLIGTMLVTKEFLKFENGQGVFTGRNFSHDRVSGRTQTHTVMIIGSGYTKCKTNYWICRNNWGKGFGFEGLFRIDTELVMFVYSPIVSQDEV